ncbi:hypothetical protein [Vibrio ziniensis]|uniref:Uncharacterized protein n=1 Tax=Vibrio ziniensis TaxID=2711221 RepID=A0A6G7CJP8_9VIBR|nr:hypothetical protein [Vibrio ziniensis]QIH42335.1 hypothetical protein G5S32_10150 [Vibrio ziniensis]
MHKNSKHLATLVLISSTILAGCGGDDSGSGSGRGRNTSSISAYSYSGSMLIGNCVGNSVLATNDFLIGTTSNSVSAEKLESMIKSAQASFDILVGSNNFNVNAATDLGIDSQNRLQICVETELGSNGTANYEGIIIGADNSGSALDFMFDHELTHTISANIVGKVMLTISADRWFNEGLATLIADNKILSKSKMLNLINLSNGTLLIPTNVSDHDDESIWINDGKKISNFYPAYNTAIRYAMHMGASKSDFVDMLFKIRDIENSCKEQQEAYYYDSSYAHGSISITNQSSYCDDTDAGYETKYNDEIISGDDVMQVAFDEIMSRNGSGLTMNMLKDNDYFVNYVVNGFLK